VASSASALAPAPTASIDELRILRRSMPRYPRSARLRGAEGVTVLRVLVERSGRVGIVEVDRSAGDQDLDRAAVRAIRSWRFATGAPSREMPRRWVLIPVEFRLR
jgi:protein TonB